jgi:hypothetical protein
MRPPAGVSGIRLGNADERSIITTKERTASLGQDDTDLRSFTRRQGRRLLNEGFLL